MIRVVVVEDSGLIRKTIRRALDAIPDITIVGEAEDPFEARERIFELAPDVVTLDLNLPRMDGLSFLQKLMKHHPLPVIILSSVVASSAQTAVEALSCGAFDVIAKPGPGIPPKATFEALIASIRAAASAPALPATARASEGRVANQHGSVVTPSSFDVVAIGASTGGVRAIETLLRGLPRDGMPGIAVVQHLPAPFPEALATRLDASLDLDVRQARDGDLLEEGSVLIAPGGAHLRIDAERNGYVARVVPGPLVNYHRPSVDVLFTSLADSAGPNVIGVLLTGMGADGAAGLLELRRAGAATIAQDEASSTVFGMPRQAIRLGAAQHVRSIDLIPVSIVDLLDGAALSHPLPDAQLRRHRGTNDGHS